MNSAMSVVDMPLSSMGTWGPMEQVFGEEITRRPTRYLSTIRLYKDATYLVTYLDNHDKPRFNGAPNDGTPAASEQYFYALNFYFTARGIPCISYGTELRMPGGSDPDNRRFLGLEGMRKAKADPVYGHLKKLNAIRKAAAPLRKGVQTRLLAAPQQYAFRRDHGGETAAVFLNKDGNPARLKAAGLPDGSYRELYPGEEG